MGDERVSFLKRYGIGVGLGVIGLGLIGVGGWQYLKPRPVEVEVVKEASRGGVRKVEEVKSVVVNVSGAVRNPGVYQLKVGSRVAEALTKAGGLVKDADRAWIDKNLNLARKLRDGEKIYIPRVGEEYSGSEVLGAKSGVVNVNTASLSELDSLWGVGETRARAIIEHRPYSSLEELVSKAGIPQSVLEKNEGRMGL